MKAWTLLDQATCRDTPCAPAGIAPSEAIIRGFTHTHRDPLRGDDYWCDGDLFFKGIEVRGRIA